MNDHQLGKKLSKWNPELPVEAEFHRNVWKQIEATRARKPSAIAIFEKFINGITTPIVGVPLAVFTLTFAVLLAFHNGTETREQTWSSLEISYNEAIDPQAVSPE